eukprot:1144072-Pelagomonas_calceolata.AAC.1
MGYCTRRSKFPTEWQGAKVWMEAEPRSHCSRLSSRVRCYHATPQGKKEANKFAIIPNPMK